MEGLRIDHWQTITKFLTIRDMCRLMCVSHTLFHLLVDDDRLWIFQEQRICALFPNLKPLFDNCRTSTEAKKRHKTEWVMPRKGTWWFFKRWLLLACDMGGIKELCLKEEMHPIVFAMIRITIPCPELITEEKMVKCEKKTYQGRPLYNIHFWSRGAHYPGNRITYIIRHGSNYFDCEFFHIGTSYNARRDSGLHSSDYYGFFNAWRAVLFQEQYQSCWSPLFTQLMQNI